MYMTFEFPCRIGKGVINICYKKGILDAMELRVTWCVKVLRRRCSVDINIFS